MLETTDTAARAAVWREFRRARLKRLRRSPQERRQCIMKERPASEGRSRMRRRLRSAALCWASLRYGGARE